MIRYTSNHIWQSGDIQSGQRVWWWCYCNTATVCCMALGFVCRQQGKVCKSQVKNCIVYGHRADKYRCSLIIRRKTLWQLWNFAAFLTFWLLFHNSFAFVRQTHTLTHALFTAFYLSLGLCHCKMNKWQIYIYICECHRNEECDCIHLNCLWCCDFQSALTHTHACPPPPLKTHTDNTKCKPLNQPQHLLVCNCSSLAFVWRRSAGCLCTERFTCTHDTATERITKFFGWNIFNGFVRILALATLSSAE